MKGHILQHKCYVGDTKDFWSKKHVVTSSLKATMYNGSIEEETIQGFEEKDSIKNNI